MPKPALLSKTAYTALRDDIAEIFTNTRSQAQAALAQILTKAHWSVGQRIAAEKITQKAGYHNSVLKNLASDLNIDLRTLQQCLVFYKTYPNPPRTSLKWAHYRELLRLKDPQERGYYEQLAEQNELPVRKLVTSIKNDTFNRQKPTAKSGKPTAHKLTRPTSPIHFYKTDVHNVVDGDTLLLMIDLGFEVIKQQRIRLANIDAPPIDTPEGRKTKDHILTCLVPAHTILVKTDKIDIYGRYVGHIIYSLKPMTIEDIVKKGHYLNQQLLDRGLVKPL